MEKGITKLKESPCACGKNEFKAYLLDEETVLFVCKHCGVVYKVIDVTGK